MGAEARAGRVAGWLDDRTGIASAGSVLKKVFPDHWSFMLGEVALYSLVVLLLTGTFLTFWFVPSMGQVVYQGSYLPLQGVTMSEAYRSTVEISFDVRGGLLIRQIHHWAALFFTVAITVHMMRVFFTGAFRKPREINWLIGTTLSLLAIVEGFAGYSLPDDMLSGTGLRIAEGLMQSIPVIGAEVAYLVFGGAFPGNDIVPRLYSVHILLLPAVIVALVVAHLLLVVVQKHTQYPGPGRTNDNVVGYPLMPVYLAKAGGFFFMVFGVIAAVSALVTINPIWMFGPYDPTTVSAGSQPDWYMGFAEGALRLMLPWEFQVFGHTLSLNVLIPGILLIPTMYGLAGAYPFLERWVTRAGSQEHHLLDRPRYAPGRTGMGVLALTFYGILFLAGGNDLIALKLRLSLESITMTLRVMLVLAPLAAAWVTRRICLSLQRHDRDLLLHGRETGRLVRTAGGGVFETHEPLSPFRGWPLVSGLSSDSGLAPGMDRREARRGHLYRARAALARFYLDPVDAPTPEEVIAAHHDETLDEAALRGEQRAVGVLNDVANR
jgi:ubiquinol-cytochrome c reductase cytochrome b subunit